MTRKYTTLSPVSSAQTGDQTKDILALVKLVDELQRAVIELRKGAAAAATDADGEPSNGQDCPVLQGIFLRLTQTSAAPNLLKASHSLGRIPQVAIFVKSTAVNQILIAGDLTAGVAPASSTEVTFKLNGSSGEEHICILF